MRIGCKNHANKFSESTRYKSNLFFYRGYSLYVVGIQNENRKCGNENKCDL